MKNLIYILFSVLPIFIFSQQSNLSNIWVMGAMGPVGSGNNPMQIDFSSGSFNLNLLNRSIQFNHSASTICDKQGNLLFYTNGIVMGNKLNDTLQNSVGFNPGTWSTNYSDGLTILPLS